MPGHCLFVFHRAAGTYQKGDERILGSGDFDSQVLAGAQEKVETNYRLAAAGYNLDRLIRRVAELLGTTR